MRDSSGAGLAEIGAGSLTGKAQAPVTKSCEAGPEVVSRNRNLRQAWSARNQRAKLCARRLKRSGCSRRVRTEFAVVRMDATFAGSMRHQHLTRLQSGIQKDTN